MVTIFRLLLFVVFRSQKHHGWIWRFTLLLLLLPVRHLCEWPNTCRSGQTAAMLMLGDEFVSKLGASLMRGVPSGRRYRTVRSRTSRFRNSLFPSAVTLLNSGTVSDSQAAGSYLLLYACTWLYYMSSHIVSWSIVYNVSLLPLLELTPALYFSVISNLFSNIYPVFSIHMYITLHFYSKLVFALLVKCQTVICCISSSY